MWQTIHSKYFDIFIKFKEAKCLNLLLAVFTQFYNRQQIRRGISVSVNLWTLSRHDYREMLIYWSLDTTFIKNYFMVIDHLLIVYLLYHVWFI